MTQSSTVVSIPGSPSRSSRMTDSDKNGQSAEDEEKRQRDAILRQAMMDDLSIARVENLPLEDVDPPPPRVGRHDGRAPDRGHGNTRLSMPQAPPDQSSIWAEAHRMGLFDDDDARAVRELDDLGGGRIYVTRQQEVSALGTRLVHGIREAAHRAQMQNPELHSRAARNYHGHGREIPPNRKINFGKDMTTSAFGVVHHTAQPVRRFPANYQPSPTATRPVASTDSLQMVPPNRGLPSSRNGVASHATSTAPFKEGPRATSVQPRYYPANQAQRESRPTIAPRALRQISMDIRQQSAPTTRRQLRPPGNENIVPVSGKNPPQHSPELSNVLFKCEVDYPSRTMLYLSAAGRPHMGFFTITREGQLVCQWPISQYHYHDIDGLRLSTMFNTPEGPRDSRTMHFMVQMDTDDFHRTLKRLRAGEYLGQVNESSKEMLETTTQDSTLIAVEASPMPTPQSSVPQARAEEASVSDLDTVLRQPIAPHINTAHCVESQEMLVGTLIDLDTSDDAPSTVQPQYALSEAAELLSTLDPIDYKLEHVDDDFELQQAQSEDMDLLSTLGPDDYELEHVNNTLLPTSPSQQLLSKAAEPNYGLEFVKQEFVDNYRTLLQNLIKVLGTSPAYKTNSGASVMIEGLQMCVTKQAMADECGLDDSTKRELLKEIWGDSQPVDDENSINNTQLSNPNPPPHRSKTSRPPPTATTRASTHETTRPPPPGVTSKTRRRVYARQSLVSLYDNRLQPPHWLTELGFMPTFSRRNPPPSTRQTLEATLSATTPSPAPHTIPRPAPDNWLSRSQAHLAWVLASQAAQNGEPTGTRTSDSTVQGVHVEAVETVELTSTTPSESTAQNVQAEAQEVQIEEHRPDVSVVTAGGPSHEEHVGAHIQSGPELISLAVPEPTRPSSTQTNVRGLRHSRWARFDDRLDTEGNFTGPQFLTSAILRDLAQLDPQAPVNATPEELANIFSARPSNQRMEHVASGPTPGLQNGRSIPVPDHRPTPPVNNPTSFGEVTPKEETPRATQRVFDTFTQQPSSVSAPPARIESPVASSRLSNHSVADSMVATSPAPESSSISASSSTQQSVPPVIRQSVPPSSSANPGLAGSMWARIPTSGNSSGTNPPLVQAPPPAPVVEAQLRASVVEVQPPALALRPINHGLAGSRFASGKVLHSAGTFTGYLC